MEFAPCLWQSFPSLEHDPHHEQQSGEDLQSLTIQPGTRPLTGDILLPSSLIDALFCEIEARAGYGNKADPAEHLEKRQCLVSVPKK